MKLTTMMLSAAIALTYASTSLAADAPAPIEPMALGDNRMSCDALVAEAGNMQSVLGGAPEAGIFGNEQMVDIGSSLAMNGVIRSGIGGRAAGAVGFLGRAAKAAGKRKAEAEAARKQVAVRRWYYVVGLYQGNDCDNQPAHTSVTVSAEAAPVTTTTE
ncbi:hypothetical protein MNBD_ALPHA06-766 [hydrothermal vent metagenome]|uniref:Uncharacterized protein n=1 Tax=hydrothermal vent metagenome TaxID=652676 RepID=A0A3B0SPT5_9ZZZZ